MYNTFHNPPEYGGYKYNAADAGPATSKLTIPEAVRLIR
jgi:phosphoglucomutase